MSLYYFLYILESGEFCFNGDRGRLGESTSLRSILFSTGLLILGLDFLLLDCNQPNEVNLARVQNCRFTKLSKALILDLTFAGALAVILPPEPKMSLSFW